MLAAGRNLLQRSVLITLNGRIGPPRQTLQVALGGLGPAIRPYASLPEQECAGRACLLHLIRDRALAILAARASCNGPGAWGV